MTVCLTCENQEQCELLEKLHCECSNYKMLPTKAETHYDRIISKTPEELAAYVGHASLCVTIQDEDGGAWCSQYGSCNECIRDWLRQEVSDG